MFQLALEGYEKSLGSVSVTTHIPALNALENLGSLCLELGQVANALSYYQRAHSGIEAVVGSGSERYAHLSQRMISVRSPERHGKIKRFVLRQYFASMAMSCFQIFVEDCTAIASTGK